ncbi:MAG: Carbohydrate kinase, FGGY-like protein, partial [Massilia sp.]|nr:Carbohydrate kinase, FGGY-like protein [Massilia sp.]
MPDAPAFAAVDLGASSGRVLTGRLAGDRMTLREERRFANRPVQLPDGLHWNPLQLFAESIDGLRAAGSLRGIGVDTWGVDYGLVDERGRLLGLPFHYRDGRSDAMMRRAFDRVDRETQYAISGIQTLPFNTVFQLLAEEGGAACAGAARLAFIPDLIALWLSGELANERTNASTTGLLDARTGEWSAELVERLGLPGRLFGDLVDPGTLLGTTVAGHGVGATPVYAVASHDTASAFAAAPIRDEHAAILSSGTWSLLGLELAAPVLTDAARDANLTNERGIDGTTRLLKNVMGLWLEQECARGWGLGHADVFRAAEAAPSGGPLFDPDAEVFLAPGDMPSRIATECARSGQPAPLAPGAVTRSILESLACKYRFVLERLQVVSGRAVHRIHVIGGGARVALLCRL